MTPSPTTEDVIHAAWIAGLFILPIGAYLWILYKRLQARLLEHLAILTFSTLPGGMMLKYVTLNSYEWEGALWVSLIMFPASLILATSMWGLFCALRLKEGSTWARLGMIAVGWLLAGSVACGMIGLFLVCRSSTWLFGQTGDTLHGLLLFIVSVFLLWPGIMLERHCRNAAKQSPVDTA